MILSLLIFTIFMGLVNVLICHFFSRLVLTPIFFYWLSWLLAIGSAALSEYWNLLPPITEFGNSIIIKSHIGCFFGSTIASLLHVLVKGKIVAKNKNAPAWMNRLNIDKTKYYLRNSIITMGFVATSHLIYRISLLDNVSVPFVATTFISSLRYSFLFTEIGYTRYFNFLMSLIFVVTTILGVLMALKKVSNIKLKLGILLLIVSMHSLASGGRHFILIAGMYFVLTYTLVNGEIQEIRSISLNREYGALLKSLIIISLVFIIIGNLRAGRAVDSFQGDTVEISNEFAANVTAPNWFPSAVIEYAGVSVAACGPMSEYIGDEQTYGKYTIALLYKWLAKFGVLSADLGVSDETEFHREIIREYDLRIGWAPGTALPYLSADFGVENLIYSMGLLVFLNQFLFLFFLRKKLAGLYIATHCCYALFFTTQTIVTIDAQFVIALLLILYVQRQIIKRYTYITAA